MWLPWSAAVARENTVPIDAAAHWYPLQPDDNPFLETEVRLARRTESWNVQRIVGRLRIGGYWDTAADTWTKTGDYTIDWGICIAKGDLAPDGTWTIQESSLPDPGDGFDDPEKWLFKDMAIFNNRAGSIVLPTGNTGLAVDTTGIVSSTQYPMFHERPGLVCTDEYLPDGSKIDIKPKRWLRYEERLGVVVKISGDDSETAPEFFLDTRLRILIGKGL